jgi:uncharacterized protein with HEPN domain
MSERSNRVLLEDMRDTCARIARYLAGIDRDRFLMDEMRADAVVHNLAIIGEAANRLTDAFREEHSKSNGEK